MEGFQLTDLWFNSDNQISDSAADLLAAGLSYLTNLETFSLR